MNQFPVISSTLSGLHLAILLQQNYGLGNDTTCRIIKAGVNHSYIVNDGDNKYVLRVYALNWRTETEIMEELKLLNLLKQHAISLSYPIADSTDNYIQKINAPEGTRYGVLFSFAEGDKLFNYSVDSHFAIGKLMGEIHKVTQNLTLDRTTYTPERLLVESFKEFKHFLPSDTEEMKFMASAQSFLLNELRNANTGMLRKGAVHLDIWFDNLNISKNGKITLFDFDFCGNGWLCLDIAYYILQVYSTEKDETERDLKVESFLKGYESVLEISEEEKRLIPVLGVSLYFFYLGVQCQRYDNWSNVFLNEAHLKRFIMLLVKKYYDTRQIGQIIRNP
jgi:Ser/Thr protein kinase RdoA (MazF antagonist)